MRTVALAKLLSSVPPGTALMGLCFTPCALKVAVTSPGAVDPKEIPYAADLDANSLLKVVKELQVCPLKQDSEQVYAK